MAEQPEKANEKNHSPKGGLREKIQNFLITLLGLNDLIRILTSNKSTTPTSPSPSKVDLTDHIPGDLTIKDEIEFGEVLDLHPNPRLKAIELTFRNEFKARGYSEGRYRAILIGYNRNFGNKLSDPPPNKPSCVQYASILISHSAIEFFDQLIKEADRGGTPEEIYVRQERWAKGRDLLVETSDAKKIFQWSSRNKPETILAIILFLLGIILFLIWLMC